MWLSVYLLIDWTVKIPYIELNSTCGSGIEVLKGGLPAVVPAAAWKHWFASAPVNAGEQQTRCPASEPKHHDRDDDYTNAQKHGFGIMRAHHKNTQHTTNNNDKNDVGCGGASVHASIRTNESNISSLLYLHDCTWVCWWIPHVTFTHHVTSNNVAPRHGQYRCRIIYNISHTTRIPITTPYKSGIRTNIRVYTRIRIHMYIMYTLTLSDRRHVCKTPQVSGTWKNRTDQNIHASKHIKTH